MYKLLRYIRQNRVKILTIGIFIIFAYAIIQIANNSYKNNNTETNNTKLILTPTDGSVKILNKDCEKLINEFLSKCTSEKYDEAYKYLSNDCKENVYNSLDDFKKNYCTQKDVKGKGFSIEKKSDITNYTYCVTFNNMLSSGKLNSDKFEDYYTIVVDENELKLNINSYLKTEKVNKTTLLNNIKIEIKSINIFVSYQEVIANYVNDTKNNIYISNMYVIDSNNKKVLSNNTDTKNIKSNEETNITYTFSLKPYINIQKVEYTNIKYNNSENEEKLEINL